MKRPINGTLAEAVRARLREIGQTQKWLAAQLGISGPRLSQYLNGQVKRAPSWEPRMLQILGLDLPAAAPEKPPPPRSTTRERRGPKPPFTRKEREIIKDLFECCRPAYEEKGAQFFQLYYHIPELTTTLAQQLFHKHIECEGRHTFGMLSVFTALYRETDEDGNSRQFAAWSRSFFNALLKYGPDAVLDDPSLVLEQDCNMTGPPAED